MLKGEIRLVERHCSKPGRLLKIIEVRCGLERVARDFKDLCGSVDGNMFARAQTADILLAEKCPCLVWGTVHTSPQSRVGMNIL